MLDLKKLREKFDSIHASISTEDTIKWLNKKEKENNMIDETHEFKVGNVYQWEYKDSIEKWKLTELDITGNHLYTCIYTTDNSRWKVGDRNQYYISGNEWVLLSDYKYHPTDGEICWNKKYKNKVKVFRSIKGEWFLNWIDNNQDMISYNFDKELVNLEPYDNQDKKIIDFSIKDQWVKMNDSKILFKTAGDYNKTNLSFKAIPFGDIDEAELDSTEEWELVSDEEMKPILESYNKLFE